MIGNNNILLKIKTLIHKFFDLLRLSQEEKEIFRTVIGMENIRRVLILSLFAIPTSMFYLVIIRLKAASASGGRKDRAQVSVCRSLTT